MSNSKLRKKDPRLSYEGFPCRLEGSATQPASVNLVPYEASGAPVDLSTGVIVTGITTQAILVVEDAVYPQANFTVTNEGTSIKFGTDVDVSAALSAFIIVPPLDPAIRFRNGGYLGSIAADVIA